MHHSLMGDLSLIDVTDLVLDIWRVMSIDTLRILSDFGEDQHVVVRSVFHEICNDDYLADFFPLPQIIHVTMKPFLANKFVKLSGFSRTPHM